jgi:nucleotide-binding universal stress UspA family protein
MKKILFPTDLSVTSGKALKYAQYVAIHGGYELLLFHSSMTEQDKLKAEEHLKKITEELSKGSLSGEKTTSYSAVCVEGMPVAEVANWMQKTENELLVMATSGDHRDHFQGIYLRSNTASILEQIQKPVLFYPLHTEVSSISNILVSIDVLKYSKTVLISLAAFASSFAAKVQFVYVSNVTTNQVSQAIAEFQEFLLTDFVNSSLKVVSDDGYDKSISAFIEQEGADLMVMIKYKKQFWEKWFAKSHTQDMTYTSAIPVLVLSAE